MADFSIQRGSITVNSATTGTITAGVDYTAPASLGSSFIRIVGLNNNGIGTSDSDFNGAPRRNNHVINNPSNLLTSITFERDEASSSVVEIFYEIIEYIGSASGPNEFIVRHEEAITFTSTGATLDSSTFGSVATAADLVVFNTGMRSAANSRGEGAAGRFTWEYISGSTLARGTRDVQSDGGEVSIAVVEFTGSNWTVQRVEHTFVASATNETETITTVGSLSRAFTHYQSRYSTIDNGADGLGFEAWLSAVTTLTFNATNIDSGMAAVAWVVDNSETGSGAMSVERISGSRADNAGGGTDPDSWTESHSSGATDITTVSVLGETGTSDKTGDMHLCGIGFEVNSLTVIDLKRGRDEGNRDYRFEVVTWPEDAGGSPYTLTTDSGSYSYTGTANSLLLGSVLAADTDQYVYSGTDAALTFSSATDYPLTTESGSYAYSGTAAGLAFGGNLSADTVQYTYSGTDAALTFASAGSFTLSADSGAYTYSGTNASLVFGGSLSADSGAYAYAGTAATLTHNYNLSADTVQYTYTGTNADFVYHRALGADSGSYIYTGAAAAISATGDVWTDQSGVLTTWTEQSGISTIWTPK